MRRHDPRPRGRDRAVPLHGPFRRGRARRHSALWTPVGARDAIHSSARTREGTTMKRYLLVAAAALAALATAHAAGAATLCVGPHSGCFAQLQPAVTAAHDGDTITIAPGTYAGGVTIDKSIKLQGTSAGATTIAGGGPVRDDLPRDGLRRPGRVDRPCDDHRRSEHERAGSRRSRSAAASGFRTRNSTTRRSTAPAPPSRSRTASSPVTARHRPM